MKNNVIVDVTGNNLLHCFIRRFLLICPRSGSLYRSVPSLRAYLALVLLYGFRSREHKTDFFAALCSPNLNHPQPTGATRECTSAAHFFRKKNRMDEKATRPYRHRNIARKEQQDTVSTAAQTTTATPTVAATIRGKARTGSTRKTHAGPKTNTLTHKHNLTHTYTHTKAQPFSQLSLQDSSTPHKKDRSSCSRDPSSNTTNQAFPFLSFLHSFIA